MSMFLAVEKGAVKGMKISDGTKNIASQDFTPSYPSGKHLTYTQTHGVVC